MTRINDFPKAVELLKAGELVAFPTETVYGLGADASNPEAIKKIFAAKGRPADHPVIVHISEIAQLKQWAKNIPESTYVFAEHFWPGALTLILPVADHVSTLITGNQKTIGIRMPSHPVARELLIKFGGAIAAPSANRFGRISPTAAAHVKDELGDSVAMILDGGNCPLGIESTIIDLTHEPARLLRPGPLNKILIEKITGINISEIKENAPRVSGSLESHYAPKTPVKLMDYTLIQQQLALDAKIAVLSFHEKPENINISLWQKMSSDAAQYAHDLYAVLRKIDAQQLSLILIEQPPTIDEWQAVNDRLKRASGGVPH